MFIWGFIDHALFWKACYLTCYGSLTLRSMNRPWGRRHTPMELEGGGVVKTERFDIVLRSITGIPLALYGYAFHKAWISIGTVPTAALAPTSDFIPGGIVNAAIAFFLGLLALKFDSTRFRRTALAVGVFLQVVTAIALTVSYFIAIDAAAFGVFVKLANAGGTVLLSALWVDLYALLNPVRVAYLNAVVIIIAQAFIFVVEGNDIIRILPVIAVIPLITGCLYLAAANKGAQENPPTQISKSRFLFPYKAVLFIGVFSFAYGIASMGGNVINARYTAVVPAAVVLLFIFLNTRRFNISILVRMAMPLMLAGFLLVSFIPGEVPALSSLMLYSGFATMEMLLLLIVCTISYSSGTSAIWLFGILGGTQFLMRSLGVMFGGFALSSLGDAEYAVVSVIAIVAVVLASFTLMSEKSLFSFWGARKRSDNVDGEQDGACAIDDSLEIRINALSAAHSLTDRETEVLYLAVKGKTNTQIGRDMFISVGTVKAHLYHIYQKLGIHSRKELMELVGK